MAENSVSYALGKAVTVGGWGRVRLGAAARVWVAHKVQGAASRVGTQHTTGLSKLVSKNGGQGKNQTPEHGLNGWTDTARSGDFAIERLRDSQARNRDVVRIVLIRQIR